MPVKYWTPMDTRGLMKFANVDTDPDDIYVPKAVYDALESQLASAHEHHRQGMAAVEAQWQAAWGPMIARKEALEAALREEIRVIREYQGDGSTHYEDCWKSHRLCAAVKRMADALGSETGGQQHD